jgi:hypothetical protein
MFLGSKVRPVRRSYNLAPYGSRLSIRSGILNVSEPYRPPWPLTGIEKILFNGVAHGNVVVKALCYRPEGRGFVTR